MTSSFAMNSRIMNPESKKKNSATMIWNESETFSENVSVRFMRGMLPLA